MYDVVEAPHAEYTHTHTRYTHAKSRLHAIVNGILAYTYRIVYYISSLVGLFNFVLFTRAYVVGPFNGSARTITHTL